MVSKGFRSLSAFYLKVIVLAVPECGGTERINYVD